MFKVQFVKVAPTFNSAAKRYFGSVMLEENGQDRKVIDEGEFNL
ncbi:hypothetical protein [Chryseobacterium piperi]|nr:hypothetical protein [Chryseobacterium piperi]